ncbi:hypothetical protein M5K25_021476 [Dendrobium thyrsiflorum]|uniref:Uncharacterized protein n=1 Tax=Dendrobium thyrsiflorum TaxID=117978 RepID=A0ABD0UCP7_DENTH
MVRQNSGVEWWSGGGSAELWHRVAVWRWFGRTPASGGDPAVVRQNSGGGRGGVRRQERSPIFLLVPWA